MSKYYIIMSSGYGKLEDIFLYQTYNKMMGEAERSNKNDSRDHDV